MAQVHCGLDSKIKFPEIKHPAATARSGRHERLDFLLTENRADEVIGTDALGDRGQGAGGLAGPRGVTPAGTVCAMGGAGNAPASLS
jgi:hypothetical protein